MSPKDFSRLFDRILPSGTKERLTRPYSLISRSLSSNGSEPLRLIWRQTKQLLKKIAPEGRSDIMKDFGDPAGAGPLHSTFCTVGGAQRPSSTWALGA